jgi:oligopeptide/dipeptide ABC transporter ATP-binding protein
VSTEREFERTESDSGADDDPPLLSVSALKTHFPVDTGVISSLTFDGDGLSPIGFDSSAVRAVDGVSFTVERGSTFGVVGESGCGKSTLARTLLGLEEPTDGTIEFDGENVTTLDTEQQRWFRENVQMAFQDPQSSLNPRRTVGSIVADPLEGAGWEASKREDRVLELLEDVGLRPEYYNRYPHEFSGGQRQRINLARALSVNPDLVVADEPVSGLDMSVKAQILRLMNDLQDEYNLTYLFISHDLGVIRNVADRVAVMYLGDFVEVGPTDELFTDPHHPYTRELVSAVPNPNPDTPAAESQLLGDVPSPEDPPTGCKFHPRCPEVIRPHELDRDSYRRYAQLRMDVITRELPADRSPGAVQEEYFRKDPPDRIWDTIERALEHVEAGDRDGAIEILHEHASECILERPPERAINGRNHVSACHLPADNREPFQG